MQDRMLRVVALLLLLICSVYVAELIAEKFFGRYWALNFARHLRMSGEGVVDAECTSEYARGKDDALKIVASGRRPTLNFDDLIPTTSECTKAYARGWNAAVPCAPGHEPSVPGKGQ
jgi:hypothetical protein